MTTRKRVTPDLDRLDRVVADARRARDQLIARGGPHARVLARGRALRCALNQVMADEATPVPDGAEVAFFPPVTGG